MKRSEEIILALISNLKSQINLHRLLPLTIDKGTAEYKEALDKRLEFLEKEENELIKYYNHLMDIEEVIQKLRDGCIEKEIIDEIKLKMESLK